MTDETPDASADEPGAPPAPAESAATAVESPPAVIEPAPAATVSFWHRPNVERYLVPLITPILVVVGLVVYVLNLSRVFLSAHGHTSVVVGSIVTALILLGATVLSNSRLRSSSITLMTLGFILVAIGSGWLVLGHSQVKNEGGAALPATGPCAGSFTIKALPTIKFAPVSLSMKTGVYCVTLEDTAAAPHTLDFDDSSTLFPGLQVANQGEKVTGRIFFGAPGDFTYFCAIPGHRAAGMQGVVHVTGSPITLAAAEAAGKPSGGTTGAG